MQIRPATIDDLDPLFELLTVRSRTAFGTSELKRAYVQQDLELAGTDNLVAVEGSIVGYASLDSAHDLNVAATDPAVNDALLAAVDERARERGFDGLSAIVVPEDAPFHALVTRSGFDHTADILRMWRELGDDLPEAQWPEGIAVRTYEESDANAVHALLDRSYLGWDETYVARPHEDWVQWMTAHDGFDPGLWFLAERNGELVACALHWRVERGYGWVKDIVVAESERGRGLGKALLHHAFREYASRGATRIGLKVDSTNPTGAPRLYERVGFAVDRRYGIWTKTL